MMAVKKKKTENDTIKLEKVESLFSKEQLLKTKRFQDRKDIVNAILSPDKQYTVNAVEEMIEKYMKGQVK